MKLQDKVIAITGAGGIICSAFAKALAEEGAKVALLDINYDAAKQYADEIGENAIWLDNGSEVELTDGQTFKAQAFLYGTSGGIRVARFKLK